MINKQSDHLPTTNPFQRFELGNRDLSRAELAYCQSTKEGWLNGYGFEAIVASHAIHNESCFACKKKGFLFWSGGSDTSWRDLYCNSCQSCFEIKSKKDAEVVKRIFGFKSLHGGSYRGYCEEAFPGRGGLGRDFVVLVSRAPCSTFSRPSTPWGKTEPLGDVWEVEIAEIHHVLPQLTAMSFVDYKQGKERITLKTVVKPGEPKTWFQVPKQKDFDFETILQGSFEKVFPGQWNALKSKAAAEIQKSVLSDKPKQLPRDNIARPLKSGIVWPGRSSQQQTASDSYGYASSCSTYAPRSYHDEKRYSRRSDMASLNRSFGGLSIRDDYNNEDDYDYTSYGSGKYNYSKLNGYNMTTNGYNRKRGSGKKNHYKYNDSYY